MTNDKVKAEIERILDTSRIGVLSTALNNIPNSRYMVFIMMIIHYIQRQALILKKLLSLRIILEHMS